MVDCEIADQRIVIPRGHVTSLRNLLPSRNFLREPGVLRGTYMNRRGSAGNLGEAGVLRGTWMESTVVTRNQSH